MDKTLKERLDKAFETEFIEHISFMSGSMSGICRKTATWAFKLGMLEGAKIAKSDDYIMLMTHKDIEDGELANDRIKKIRQQARNEVAKAIEAQAGEL